MTIAGNGYNSWTIVEWYIQWAVLVGTVPHSASAHNKYSLRCQLTSLWPEGVLAWLKCHRVAVALRPVCKQDSAIQCEVREPAFVSQESVRVIRPLRPCLIMSLWRQLKAFLMSSISASGTWRHRDAQRSSEDQVQDSGLALSYHGFIVHGL